MKERSRDELLVVFFFVTGALMILLRKLLDPSIPTIISLVVGCTILGVGVILTVLECRHHLGVSYAYAENWNGGGFINSGVILGISVFFFSGEVKLGVVMFVLINIALLLKWKVLSGAKK